MDTLVPLDRNSGALVRRYRALGGEAELVVVKGKGHEVCPEFFQNQRLLDFFLQRGKLPAARPTGGGNASAPAATLPKYDHIVIVFEENKDYGQVIGSNNAPYINHTLLGAYRGVSLTNMYAEQHPSQPNYLAFFSGSNQGVNSDRQHDLPPMTTPNLGASLLAKGYTFKGYAEDLPSVGYTGARHSYTGQDDYVLKHCPWVNWQQSGASQANSIPASLNVPFCTATNNRGGYPSSYYFPTDYSQLPTVSMVIPNEMNEMHSGSSIAAEVRAGDSWLHTYLDGYAQWARTHNSLLIVTWDEDGSTGQAKNQLIPTVLVGANLNAGNYGEKLNHYNLLRTLEDMYGLPYCTSNDAKATPITDVFAVPEPSTLSRCPPIRPEPAAHATPFTASPARLRGHRKPR